MKHHEPKWNNMKLKDYRTKNKLSCSELARKIGVFLASKRISIVYGGGNEGLMGEVSNAAIKEKAKVIGIIPEFLKKGENINYNISETIVVKSMSERKKILFERKVFYNNKY